MGMTVVVAFLGSTCRAHASDDQEVESDRALTTNPTRGRGAQRGRLMSNARARES
jgi:hypothetical protein